MDQEWIKSTGIYESEPLFCVKRKWVINSICKRRARNYELQQTMQTHHAPRLEVEVLRF